MTVGPIKSWLDRLMERAIALAVAVWLIDWSWQTVRPLLPMLVVAVVTAGFFRWQRR